MRLSIEEKIALGFAAALLLLIVMGLEAYCSTVPSVPDAARVKHTQDFLTRHPRIFPTVVDAELSHSHEVMAAAKAIHRVTQP